MAWAKTRKCGCGDCALRPMEEGPCRLEEAPGAKWLWAQIGKDKDLDDMQEITEDEYSETQVPV
jgi:hypothetical protein